MPPETLLSALAGPGLESQVPAADRLHGVVPRPTNSQLISKVYSPRLMAVVGVSMMVGFIEGVRWTTLGRSLLNPAMLASSVIISLVLFVSGAFFFRRTERTFADVI